MAIVLVVFISPVHASNERLLKNWLATVRAHRFLFIELSFAGARSELCRIGLGSGSKLQRKADLRQPSECSPHLLLDVADRWKLGQSAISYFDVGRSRDRRWKDNCMLIQVGYELVFNCPQSTPMILMVNVHYSRASDIVSPDILTTDPETPMTAYRDGFGNWCTRIVAPIGRTLSEKHWGGSRFGKTRRGDALR